MHRKGLDLVMGRFYDNKKAVFILLIILDEVFNGFILTARLFKNYSCDSWKFLFFLSSENNCYFTFFNFSRSCNFY